MELLIWIAIGVFATWRITHDITSAMELDGPFYLYRAIRGLRNVECLPEYIKNGVDCPYCVSFWIGHIVALLLPIFPDNMSLWQVGGAYLAVSWALSGAVVWYYRRMVDVYGIESRDV